MVNISSLIANVVCGTICLILGIVLLTFRTMPSSAAPSYRFAKRMLAYCAFSGVIIDIAVTLLTIHGLDFSLLKFFFIPLMYYLQIYMMTFALLVFVHSRKVTKFRMMIYPMPMIVIVAIYALMAVTDGHLESADAYVAFNGQTATMTVRAVMYVLMAVELLISLYTITKALLRYRRKVDNFFTGSTEITANQFSVVVTFFWGYSLLAAVGSLITDATLNIVLMGATILIFIAASIFFLNMQNVFANVKTAMDIVPDEDSDPSSMESDESGAPSMDAIVSAWVRLPSKPYLKESITLKSVAETMGVSPRLLSDFLNNIYEKNFNSWINSLRIEEVKRQMQEDPLRSITELAEYAGFTDASAMSRVFKRFVGLSPSAYRNTLRK